VTQGACGGGTRRRINRGQFQKVGYMLCTAPRPGPDGDQWMGAGRLAALGYIA
jgi:hypothetical protein